MLKFGFVYSLHKEFGAKSQPRSVGVEREWVGSGNSCPERPLKTFFTQVLLIIRASVVVNPSDGLQ